MHQYNPRPAGNHAICLALLLPAAVVAAQQSAQPFDGIEIRDEALTQVYQYSQAGQNDQALALIQPLADGGDPAAQFVLGGFYSQGLGVPQDEEQAALWWRKAADQGLDRAQNEIGVMLSDGRGVPADPQQAVVFYRRAAEQGLAVAQTNLALMYWRGIGVTQNEKEAVLWFGKAATQGFGWAQYYLGYAYSRGIGLRKSERMAVEWLGKAADQEYTDAQYELGAIYKKGFNKARAAHWFARAAQRGHELAEYMLISLLGSLRTTRMHAGTEVRAQADAMAAVVKTTGAGELAYVLDRGKDWVEVYFLGGRVRGYVSTAKSPVR